MKPAVKFGELVCGDRFMCVGSLWTKIEPDAARKHSAASRALGLRGYGYHDSICGFERDDEVEFVPA